MIKRANVDLSKNLIRKYANSLLYNGDTFHVLNDHGESIYSVPAWSGRGKHMNNAKSVEISEKGPIPPGNYILGQREKNMQENHRNYIMNFLSNAPWFFGAPFRNLSDYYRTYKKYNNRDVYPNSGLFAKNPYGWGEYRFALNPDKDTKASGRTNMYLHGGDEPGSKGCIDLMHNLKHMVERMPELGLKKGMKLNVDYTRKSVPSYYKPEK